MVTKTYLPSYLCDSSDGSDSSDSTLPAQYADSVDVKDGLLNNRVCTVKFPAIEAY